MDGANTAFVMACSALVLVMTPGLAIFYGGLTNSKNVLSTMMHSFFLMGLASVAWVVYVYSLSFGPDVGGVIGNLSHFMGAGVTAAVKEGLTIPHTVFMTFQGMFAIITPALISGAFAERMKFSSFVVFSLLWLTFVYAPICHWVWGEGWLQKLGVLDFAGGLVVHLNCGVAALVAAIVVGKRKGYGSRAFIPHNLTLTLLGVGLLWFGWFGFNAGSRLAADGVAGNAFLTTHLAAAAGALSWAFAEWILKNKPTTLGVASGAVAGLGSITPASGFVGMGSALIIGLVAGVICYMAVLSKERLGYDDSLDVVGIHGVGGVWGTLATGLFASKLINESGSDGLFFGNPGLFVTQFIGVAVTIAYSFIVTLILLYVVKAILGLRVTQEEEDAGVDTSAHGEVGYNF
ncbi:ammonium transporter [Desulfomonile tiedjei]|uniref:Ammonium transporter n=1 Tax=Desulfomonile tiedjei (strain ATCC 49306 / DSM 6799 / DCB-1) TaxID=706587 RepID=I4C9L2_DESTA|nr:ammonium transporter [Desulfomonile tiedjei]AFM26253.1 ammonium transporter [Desulfomonile tiedjei DSM 6799]